MAGQKQKRRLKKDLIMPAAAGILFAEMRPGLYGSLSAFFVLGRLTVREQTRRGPQSKDF
ncbi:hypothetical protein DI05_21850 [Bacillus subtilis]|nr:hypothetical protein DI05_21850 [Bacillus subtilis]